MVESKYRWRNQELREQVEVLDGKKITYYFIKKRNIFKCYF